MLRNPAAYSRSLFDDKDKPIFHWSDLLIGPAHIPAIDIDCFAHFMGVNIYIESKPVGVMPSKHTTRILEELARQRNSVVILCGTKVIEPDLFTTKRGVVVCWVEVTADGNWRKPASVTYGTEEDFAAYIVDLKRSIAARAKPANDPWLEQVA